MTGAERDLTLALRKAYLDGVDSLSVEQLDLISSAISQAQYVAAQRKCKHLNLRLDGSNSPGSPFYCLDCGKNALPWTALNDLLAELSQVIRKEKSNG